MNSATLNNCVQPRDSLTMTTSQKYEACAWQTLCLRRQTIFCWNNATCPLLVAYDLNKDSLTDSCTWHNKTHILSTHVGMYRVKRQTIRLSGEHHFVLRPTAQQHRRQVIRKAEACWPDTLAGRCCCHQSQRETEVSASSSPCLIGLWSACQAIVCVASKLLAFCENLTCLAWVLVSVILLHRILVFLNLLVYNLQCGEEISQEQDEKCQRQHKYLKEKKNPKHMKRCFIPRQNKTFLNLDVYNSEMFMCSDIFCH